MELYKKHRPKKLKGVVGNTTTVQTLKNMMERNTLPHTTLLSGPSGCGKTTLARIIARELRCNMEMDFKELNCSDFRGVDTVREITRVMGMAPIGGKVRVWLLDECFHQMTKVLTSKGYIPISKIKEGDHLPNLKGPSEVERVFKNRVSLDRVVRMDLSNGKTIFTTKQHLFMTGSGWKESQNLNEKDLLLSPSSNILLNNVSQKEVKDEMSTMQEAHPRPSKVLLGPMFQQGKRNKKKEGEGEQYDMPRVREGILVSAMRSQKLLFQKLFGKEPKSETRVPEEGVFSGKEREDLKEDGGMETIRGGDIRTEEMLRTNEKEEPYVQSSLEKKSSGNKKDKWNASCLERREGREREIDRAPNVISMFFRMGGRISRLFRVKKKRISNELQDRHSQPRTTIGNRSGRGRPPVERSNIVRSKENQEVEGVWLENYQVYEPGNNDQSFRGVVEDKERDQGFIEFYDLQIKDHPSYCVEGVFVHNCHAMTKDAQNAALKILEDTPKHVYFILCTTEPQKMIKTIKTRCCHLPVELLTSPYLTKLINRILKREKEELDEEVVADIADASEGSARKALVILDKVLNLPPDQREGGIVVEEDEPEVIELCRMLIKGGNWAKVAKTLKAIKTEPETVRWSVLGYARTCLLGGEAKAAGIIDIFQENFYDSKEAGLALACYDVIVGVK